MSKPMTINGQVITPKMMAVIERWRFDDHTSNQHTLLQDVQDYIIENMAEHNGDELLKEVELLGLISALKRDISVLLFPEKGGENER